MTIKTISDLAELTTKPSDEDLMEISHAEGAGRFSSQKYKMGSLFKNASDQSVRDVSEKWNIGEDVDVDELWQFKKNVQQRVAETGENMVFYQNPAVLGQAGDVQDGDLIPTRSQVREQIEDYSAYIGPNSFPTCNPKNDLQNTQEYSYFWKIESGQYDSIDALDENGFKMGCVEIKETGWLVVYGWVTANAQVSPQTAWVGLYGEFGDSWTLLQVQPWVVGQNSQIMQYVGFGIPVKAGMHLKIKTGFPVNGSASGAQTYSHTLLLSERGNTVNCFVGYVIQN